MNLLIVKLSAIGDVVHTLPSLAALRRRFPDAHITWVIEEASSDLIESHPYLDRVIISHRKQWITNLRNIKKIGPALEEIRQFIAALRERRYDMVIDFHGLFKSALIVGISGAKRKIGYNSLQELSGLFLNEKIYEDMEKHAVDRYLDLPRYLGANIESPEFLIPLREENRLRVDTLLKEHKIDGDSPFVAVNPVAFWKTKLWEEKKFAELCDRIASELKTKVVFTGGKNDDVVERIQYMMNFYSANLTGKTSLRDLAYLYELATVVVTTDSGPMHIAAAVGTPTVALFGPTDPLRTGPYGEGHRVIRKGLHCSPCFKKECDTVRCMKEITVDDVFGAVKETLELGNRKS
ncbi:MAG: lipopolysaccharide heptosyltransferase II [Deltaproteobacteria bacterium]|nr:lipopolysaccharide heptosyltransferase II [Deltaproteobacteria bacterium]MBN2846041.1 lipopolysaccharide heptosyltransferase II [Deltaproteobacteria bacterium]